jgi:hypothetical protein
MRDEWWENAREDPETCLILLLINIDEKKKCIKWYDTNIRDKHKQSCVFIDDGQKQWISERKGKANEYQISHSQWPRDGMFQTKKNGGGEKIWRKNGYVTKQIEIKALMRLLFEEVFLSWVWSGFSCFLSFNTFSIERLTKNVVIYR